VSVHGSVGANTPRADAESKTDRTSLPGPFRLQDPPYRRRFCTWLVKKCNHHRAAKLHKAIV